MPAGAGLAEKEDESEHKVSQEELVKRDTPPGNSSSGAGGPGVPGSRRCCVRADSASVGVERRKASALRSQASDLDSELVPSIVCRFQPCTSPIDRDPFVSDVFHGR